MYFFRGEKNPKTPEISTFSSGKAESPTGRLSEEISPCQGLALGEPWRTDTPCSPALPIPENSQDTATIPEHWRLIKNSVVNSMEGLWERIQGVQIQKEPFLKPPQGARQEVLIPHKILRAMHILKENPLQTPGEGWQWLRELCLEHKIQEESHGARWTRRNQTWPGEGDSSIQHPAINK